MCLKLEGEVVMFFNMLCKYVFESIVGLGLKWEVLVELVGIRGVVIFVLNCLFE